MADYPFGQGGTAALPWRPMTEDTRAYYTHENPGAAFRQFSGDLAEPSSNRGRYAQSKFQEAWANYLRASESNEGLLFPDFLTGGYGQQLNNSFDMLGWKDRGEAAPSVSPGRIVW